MVGVIWLVVTNLPGHYARRRVALGQQAAVTWRELIPHLAIVSLIELALAATSGWWNVASTPDLVRAIAWGIVFPAGVADLLATLLGTLLAAFNGYPVHPPMPTCKPNTKP